MQRVTSLEPRTPHQPGKLRKLSKNVFVFTPFIFRVNKKSVPVSAAKSIDCTPSTAPCRMHGAVRHAGVSFYTWILAFSDTRLQASSGLGAQLCYAWIVQIRQK